MSADGRYIAFFSDATNLVANDTNGVADIFLRDRLTGTTTRISTDSAGNQGNAAVSTAFPSISADGRFVAFSSTATNLVAGDTNGVADIFVKDLVLGTVVRATVDSFENEANVAVSGNPAISADGRYVTFASEATNLVSGDTNGFRDVFVRDILLGTTTRISTATDGTQGNNVSLFPLISADGSRIVYQSDATNLVSGDTNAVRDNFVWDRTTGTTTRVSVDSSGNQGNGNAAVATISADGRYVAFTSTASNMVSGDTNGVGDVFIRDLTLGTTTLGSVDSNENQGNAASFSSGISADGRFLVFNSQSSNLSNGDTNGAFDIFVRDLQLGTTALVSTNTTGTIGDGGSTPSVYGGISANGRFLAFYSTATNLVGGDTNGVADIFFRDLATAGIQLMAGIVVSNQSSAKISLDLLRNYQDELNKYRASLGASVSRIGTFRSNLESSSLNYADAASRILDADVADEGAKLIAKSILQRTGAALLAQANRAPELALSFLE